MILYELAIGGESDVSAVTLADQRTQFGLKYATWKEQHKIHLAPLIEQGMEQLNPSQRAVARKHGEAVPEEEYNEDEGDVEDDDSDEEDGPSLNSAGPSSGKRKASTEETSTHSAAWRELSSEAVELPSAYHPLIRGTSAVAEAVKLEKEIRQQRADTHLDNLRTHLITSYALVKLKKLATGQKGKVRSNAAVRRKYKAIWASVRSYRTTRERMLSLGMEAKDVTYRPLLRSDVKPFTVFTDDEVVGDSRSQKKTSWIWEKLSFVRDIQGKQVSAELEAYVEDGE